MRDHLALEDRLDPDVVGDRGDDRGVLGEIERTARRSGSVRERDAEVCGYVHRVSGRAAVAECQQAPARLERVPKRRRGRRQLVAVVGERLLAERSDLLGLEKHGGADVRDDGLEVGLCLGEKRVEEAGRAGIVDLASIAPLQKSAVVEEDVDELPEQVVERLDQLLADEGVEVGRKRELPFRSGLGCKGDRQASGLAGVDEGVAHALGSGPSFAAEGDRDVIRLANRLRLGEEVSALRRKADGGKGAFANDHRVDELDRHVPGVRAGDRSGAERDEAAAAGKALRHAMAAARDRLGLRVEERLVGLGPDPGQLVEALRERRRWRAQATASARSGTPASHSRNSSTPSPVFAETSIVRAPGLTVSMFASRRSVSNSR